MGSLIEELILEIFKSQHFEFIFQKPLKFGAQIPNQGKDKIDKKGQKSIGNDWLIFAF